MQRVRRILGTAPMPHTAIQSIHEANRASWNAATLAHNSHKGDQATFLRDGGEVLFAEELELLGPLQGRRLLHLQCNCGQESLALARAGAEVLGVDFADQAIDFARNLSSRSQIRADFTCSDVYSWLTAGPDGSDFDLVYSSYGSLSWLADLEAWARGIRERLRPGGALVICDHHPQALMFDAMGRPSLPYSSAGKPVELSSGVPDYVGHSSTGLSPGGFNPGIRNFQNPYPAYAFHWGLAEICSALVQAELRLTYIEELLPSNGRRLLPDSQLDERRRYHAPGHYGLVPQTLCLRAEHH